MRAGSVQVKMIVFVLSAVQLGGAGLQCPRKTGATTRIYGDKYSLTHARVPRSTVRTSVRIIEPVIKFSLEIDARAASISLESLINLEFVPRCDSKLARVSEQLDNVLHACERLPYSGGNQ